MKITTLENGLRIIINPVKGAKSVTNLILAGAGSRYEHQEVRGISHFLEHMFFKGAEKYKTPKAVAEAVDKFGGEFNAFTGKEYAGYYIKSASRNLEDGMDILSDMLLNSKFDIAEIDKERGVILEEMNMYLDMPKYQVAWEFEELIIGDQPLGWDQIGTKELINGVKTECFKDYQKKLYTPDNIVIVLSGDIENEKGVDLVKKYFAGMSGKKAFEWGELKENTSGEKIRIINKKTEQSHIVIGVKGTPGKDLKNFWKQRVLATLLGGMMSSRMFQNVREQKGLCYQIGTSTDDYTDFGIFSTSAGVTNEKVNLAIESILQEYSKIISNIPDQEELSKAKNYLIGKILLSTEDSENLANMYGTQLLLKGKIISVDEMCEKIEKVTIDDIVNHAKMILKKENIYIAGIGPFAEGSEEKWLDLIEKSGL
ncbi:insulinase family protein [Candidatus Gracilibacteria bacterium]|nr:insulinase family protein [Candidatus Gracilibacteria bacterium]